MADEFVLDAEWLARKRTEIKNEIAYAQYKVGSTWYRAVIQSASVLSNGVVEVTFLIDHTVSGNITVTGVELYDRADRRIGGKTVSIRRADATEGVLYLCRISLFQIKTNSDGTGAYDELEQ